MASNNICGGRALRIAAEITMLAILMLASGAGAATLTTVWDEQSGSPLPFTWNYANFDGFNVSGIGTETLRVVQTNLRAAVRTIRNMDAPSGAGLTYTTTSQLIQYEVSKNKGLSVQYALSSAGWKGTSGNYYAKVNWFGEPYVALNGKANKLTKLVLEQKGNESKVLAVGETWDMGGGYILKAQSIDAKATPRQVWLTLSYDGVKLDDKVIMSGGVYTYIEKSISGESDVPIFVTYVDNVFAGSGGDFVVLWNTWLISRNATTIGGGDIFGVFEVTTINTVSGQLILENNESITLLPNTEINLAGNIKFKVVDNAAYLKFYPTVEPILNVIVSSLSVPVGVNTNVIFTVTANGSPVSGATVSLSGSAVGSAITGINGQATININASYNGTIVVEAEKTGYAKGITSLQAHSLPSTAMASWSLQENYVLNLIDIDNKATPRQARLQLSKNGIAIKDGVVTQGSTFGYCPSYFCIFNATVDAIFSGTQGNLVRLVNVRQYSESTGMPLLSNEIHLFKSGIFTGISWQLSEGYELKMMDIDAKATPRLVWLELTKNNIVVDDAILLWGQTYTYNSPTTNLRILELYVDAIFNGTQGKLIKLTNVSQYSESIGSIGIPILSDTIHLYKSANFTGISWQLNEGYELKMMDMDTGATPRLVWLELSKNNMLKDDAVLYWGQKYYYNSSGLTILTTKIDAIFKGETSSIVKLIEVSQYSETSGTALLINSSYSFISGAISRADQPLYEGYTIAVLGIDRNAQPRMAWLRLYKNDTMADEKIALQGVYRYYYPSYRLILYVEVTIFAGATTNMVLLRNLTQYSELDGHILISGVNYTIATNISSTPTPTPTATATPTPTSTPPTSVIKGDVSGDGQVTVVDALFVAQYTVGSRTLTQTQLAAADVNGDGQVTVVDALFIAQYTVGLRQHL